MPLLVCGLVFLLIIIDRMCKSLWAVGRRPVSVNGCVQLPVSGATLTRGGLAAEVSDGFCAFVTKGKINSFLRVRAVLWY